MERNIMLNLSNYLNCFFFFFFFGGGGGGGMGGGWGGEVCDKK